MLDTRLLLDPDDLGIRGTSHCSGDRLGLVGRGSALRGPAMPLAGVRRTGLAGEVGDDLPVRHGDKGVDLFVAARDQCQGRCLDAPDRNRIARRTNLDGRGARRVVPNQPVRGLASTSGCLERLHLLVIAQMIEGVANCTLRHRREPGALDRLLGTRRLINQLEDQLPLTPSVAGVDNDVDVLALDRLVQHGKLLDGALVAGLVACDLRQNRQVLELPPLVLGVVLVRLELLHEVTRGGADDPLVALQQVANLLEGARQCSRDVALHTGFFADHKFLTHQRRGG